MSESLEPPAKRARLEADAPIQGASVPAPAPAPAPDAPGSPVDDLDDDFYDDSPARPLALPAGNAPAAPSAAPAPAPAPVGFHLPGLGPTVTATQPAQPVQPQHDTASEEGELSDDEAFYQNASAVASPTANQGHVLDHAPPPTTVELDATITPTIDLQHPTPACEDTGTAQASDTALVDSKHAFLRVAEANRDNQDAEWQLDSDATDSDSESSSSSSDDSSEDGELLDPEEQVRLLLAEALDEEPGGTGKAKVKTLNEVDEQYEKPDITITEQTQITELGQVESIVENLVLIKAKTSGDEQVLESGSALCLQDRTIIGKISEQIGRVEEPRYALGFNDAAEISALGITKDTSIYYVNEHSTFVLTGPLRYQKHTDASNLHDEETNDIEFSDDEKEAEYKREQKARKRARTEGNDEAPPSTSLPIPTGPRGHVDASVAYRSMEYQGGGLKYSDDEDEDLGMYKPLARPDHFEQIVGHGAPLEDRSHVRRGMGRGRGPWGDRGRGFRGRGGGFSGRGDFNNSGQGNRGGYGATRGDSGAGRGDRGGFSNRGGNANRAERGGRGPKGQTDRGGRQQESFPNRQQVEQKNSSQQDGQLAASASPSRPQQDYQGSPVQQGHELPHVQPPTTTGGKNKNRKQRQREKRERERLQQQQQQLGQGQGQGQQQGQLGQHQQQQQNPQQQQQQHQQHQHQHQRQHQQHVSPQPSAPSNTNAYASNKQSSWPTPYSGANQVAANFASGSAPLPPSIAAPYSYAPAFAAQAPAFAAPTPTSGGGQPQQQATMAAWQQWFQLVGAMSQQQASQRSVYTPGPAPPPPPPPPPPAQHQTPAQYSYPYPQQGQTAPAANAQGQGSGQGAGSTQSLQDILRALGGNAAPR